MRTRVVTLLLAFALFWSGVSIHAPSAALGVTGAEQAPVAAAPTPMPLPADAVPAEPLLGDASAQTPAELQADAQAVLPGAETAAGPMLSLSHPVHGLASALAPPFLAGLQRPPCTLLHSA